MAAKLIWECRPSIGATDPGNDMTVGLSMPVSFGPTGANQVALSSIGSDYGWAKPFICCGYFDVYNITFING